MNITERLDSPLLASRDGDEFPEPMYWVNLNKELELYNSRIVCNSNCKLLMMETDMDILKYNKQLELKNILIPSNLEIHKTVEVDISINMTQIAKVLKGFDLLNFKTIEEFCFHQYGLVYKYDNQVTFQATQSLYHLLPPIYEENSFGFDLPVTPENIMMILSKTY